MAHTVDDRVMIGPRQRELMDMQEQHLVIGLWASTQEQFVEYVDATDEVDAVRQMDERYDHALRIVGVVTVDEHGRMVMWWCGGDG